MDKLKQKLIFNLEWANKRLELQGKGLDETQLEILEFSLLNGIGVENLGLPSVSKNTGTLHTCECNEPDSVNVKICLECDGVTH